MARIFALREDGKIGVDVHTFPVIVFIPLEAGLLQFGVRSPLHFGTANWLNFVPLNRCSLAKAVDSDQD